MKAAPVVTVAVSLLAAISPAIAQVPAHRAIAFVNVNVISMDRESVESGQTVVVQGDRIVAISPSGPPNDAVIIDGAGGYLLPGLTDSHVHLTTDMPWAPARSDFGDAPFYLAHGVTTVVNLRGTPTQLDWKRRIEAGELLGPTIYTTGEFVNEPRVTTPAEVQREIDAQARDGYDLIKFHEIFDPDAGLSTRIGLSRDSYLHMFEAARNQGLQVVGHVPVNLGLDGLLASSGGAVAHVGELVRLYFRPPLRSLLVSAATTLLLGLTAIGWGGAGLVRCWRRSSPTVAHQTRAKIVAAGVPMAYMVTFVTGSLAGVGGRFFDSGGWRGAFVAIACGFIGLSIWAVLACVRAARIRTLSIGARMPVMAAAMLSAVLAVTTASYLIPFILRSGESGRTWIASRLHDAGISVQTTLVVYEVGFGGPEAAARVLADPAFSSLTPQTQTLWRRLPAQAPPGVLTELIEVPPRYAEFTRAIAGSLHRGGVRLVAGTDAMGLPMVIPGSSLLHELRLLHQSGLTRYEAIRAATVNPATFLGKEKEFGTITVSKRADLLLLEHNPLEDLAAFNESVGVMVRGQWLPRARLQELVSRLN